MRKNPVGLVFENEAELQPVGRPFFPPLDQRERGFSKHPNQLRPIFRHLRKLGRKPLDFEDFAGYLLISDHAKHIFEQIDPAAFEFWGCDIIFDETLQVKYWLCDVLRIIDCLDEEHSDVQVMQSGRKLYYLGGSQKLTFKGDVIGTAHVFRMAHAEQTIICDDTFRKACKAAGVKGMMFLDTITKQEQ